MSICPICSSEYEQPKYREKKTCSAACGRELQRQNRPTINCDQCGESFSFTASKPQRFCSKDCYHLWTTGRKIGEDVSPTRPDLYTNICKVCMNEFGARTKDAGTCSIACRSIANIKYPKKPCEQCGEIYKPSGGASKYCSIECKNIASRVLHDCLCGKQFYSGRDNERVWSKFCSDECRNQYGLTKLGVLENHTCVGCAQEFTRMSHFPGKKLYCSNRCAKKEQKKGWSKAGLLLENGDVLIFRSRYEMRFASCCERFGIPWRNYDGPDIATSLGVYRPDFIITKDDQEYIIEVKGWMDAESLTKTTEACFELENFMIITKDELEEIEDEGFSLQSI